MPQKRTSEKKLKVERGSQDGKVPGKYDRDGQIINKYLWLEQQYPKSICKHGSRLVKSDLP